MSTPRKLLPLIFLVCVAPSLAQSGAAPAQGNDSPSQSPQPAPSQAASDKQASPDHPPAAPGDSNTLEPIKTAKAVYPDQAREKRLQGQVVVKIQVSETGDVENAEAISGDPILAKAAIEAARQWKFKPFIRHGKPEAVESKIPFNFAFSGNVTDSTVPQRVHVPSGVSAGLLIHRVNPSYPNEARRERIQGTVILQAMISKEGTIENLHLITGPPELAPAAIGAVQQWRYRPYLLEGKPVEVETQIQVNFQLSY